MRPRGVALCLALAVLIGVAIGLTTRRWAGAPPTLPGSSPVVTDTTGPGAGSGSPQAPPATSPAAGDPGRLVRPDALAAFGLIGLTGEPGVGEPPYEINPCFPKPMSAVSGADPSSYVKLTDGTTTVLEQVIATESSAEAQRIGFEYYLWHTNCTGTSAATLRAEAPDRFKVDGGSATVVALYPEADPDPDADAVGYSFVIRWGSRMAAVYVTGVQLTREQLEKLVGVIVTPLRS